MFTEWVLRRLNFFAALLAALVLLGAVIFAANLEIKDPDIWLHLASGQYILQHGQIPQIDIFSCTRAGAPWNNHEWLFQILVYTVYQHGGIAGLTNLLVVLVGFIFVILYGLGSAARKSLFQFLFLFLLLGSFEHRMVLRPDIFSLIFFVLDIALLNRGGSRTGTAAALLFIQILWVNTHGFFILGPALILIYGAGEFLKRRPNLPAFFQNAQKMPEELYRFLPALFLSLSLACFINPGFIQGAIYPFKILFSLSTDSRIFFKSIVELAPPITFANLFSLDYFPEYRYMILLSFGSLIVNRRKTDITVWLFWLLFFLFSLTALRNMLFFAIAAYFVFLANLPEDFSDDNRKFLPWSLAGKALIVGWILTSVQQSFDRGYFDFDRMQRKSEYGGIALRDFPYQAVDFLANNHISGNFMNDFNSGSYLVGRTSPLIKVFIDGRTELYGSKIYQDFETIWKGDAKLFEEYEKKFQITGAFLNYVHTPIPPGFIAYFIHHPQWRLVYFDYDAAIFLKDTPQNKKWIKAFQIDLKHIRQPLIDWAQVGAKNFIPYRYVNRAQALSRMGFRDQAQREVAAALRLHPAYFDAYRLYGKILVEEKKYDPALENLRKAKLLSSEDLETRYLLAKCFYELGILAEAQKQAGFVLDREPDNEPARKLSILINGKARGVLKIKNK
ncbi:MAG: hypothetical protein HQL23_01275 [Candidatus Omnitrophica bacterium]|nr:hypothetical protein [Candidatus Omnitrophota bacterium]